MLIVLSASILLTVNAMVMDCGINFMLRIPDEVYFNKSQKGNSTLLKKIANKNAYLPLYTDLGLSWILLASECYK